MLTQYEAQKLQHDMRKELDATPAAVWKCAAGLVILAVVAVVGSALDLAHDTGGNVAAATQIEEPQERAVADLQSGDTH